MSEIKNTASPFVQTLILVVTKLNSISIPYMITGGSAVGFWGRIRTTMDIDVLIQISVSDAEKLLKSFENEAYVDKEDILNAINRKTMFNVIFNETCFKVDFVPLDAGDAYEAAKFLRRKTIEYYDMKIFVTAPEDLIISKLRWMKSAGGSEKQIEDCQSILELNRETLDLAYINKWTHALGIEDEFGQLA